MSLPRVILPLCAAVALALLACVPSSSLFHRGGAGNGPGSNVRTLSAMAGDAGGAGERERPRQAQVSRVARQIQAAAMQELQRRHADGTPPLSESATDEAAWSPARPLLVAANETPSDPDGESAGGPAGIGGIVVPGGGSTGGGIVGSAGSGTPGGGSNGRTLSAGDASSGLGSGGSPGSPGSTGSTGSSGSPGTTGSSSSPGGTGSGPGAGSGASDEPAAPGGGSLPQAPVAPTPVPAMLPVAQPTTPAQAVPEPGTLLLVAAGLAGLAGLRRRRR